MDELIHALAATQSNRFAKRQLRDLGMSEKAIRHRVESGRLVVAEFGIYALPPFIDDDKGRWMAATLTRPESYLSRLSAACLFGVLGMRPAYETIVRPGSGGPRRKRGLVIHRSITLGCETCVFDGIPVTSMARTLLDIAGFASDKALARALRESIRLRRISRRVLGDHLGRFEGRNGSVRLAKAFARYASLPIERARSGAEIRAMEILRDAARPMPGLNIEVAGEEADLSWPRERLIVEIDGGPFHQDKGEDARKEAAWREAGWRVERLDSDHVYEEAWRLLDLAP